MKREKTVIRDEKIWQGLERRHHRWTIAVTIFLLLIFAMICFMMIYGNTVYTPDVVLRVLAGEEIKGAGYTIIKLRLPRMLAAVFSGCAFGMAGCIFQTVLRNPLASPDIIGISASTSAAAVFCISLLGMSGTSVSIIALVVGIMVSTVIYLLASKGGFSHTRMILIGIGAQAMMQAVVSWVLSKTSEHDVANTIRWMNGSLNNARIQEGIQLMVVVVLGTLILLCYCNRMKLLELGDEYAQVLGGDPKRMYPVLTGTAVLMVAFGTAAVGPISSVAFLAGPLATRIAGRSRSVLLPAALLGCVLVLAADLLGQFAFSTRYPVGVITGLLGGPYLLYLLITMNRRGDL